MEAKMIIGGTIFILLFGIISSTVITRSQTSKLLNLQTSPIGSWACTTDVQVCPDGSSVGRIPPYCQFSPCPMDASK